MAAAIKLGWMLLKKFIKEYLKRKAQELATDGDFIKNVLMVILIIFCAVPLFFTAVINHNGGNNNGDATGSAANLDSGIGALSFKYEGGGDPGICVDNPSDPGGLSCGAYQLAANPGTLGSFVNWLSSSYSQFYSVLNGVPESLNAFGSSWRNAFNSDKTKFMQAQTDFIAATHYLPQVDKMKQLYGFDASTRSLAVQEMFWSYAVQLRNHTPSDFGAAVGSNWTTMTDEQIITAMYNYRIAHYSCCTRRFVNEKADCLALLAQEEASGQTNGKGNSSSPPQT